MIATIIHEGETIKVDFDKPLDISIPLHSGAGQLSAWYVPPVRFEPVRNDRFTGSVREGGDVNFKNVYFNPHGHGTHTECYGHISKEDYAINDALKNFMFLAQVVTVTPELRVHNDGKTDRIITLAQIKSIAAFSEALVIRTLPNTDQKLTQEYSGTNPAYIEPEMALYLREQGVKHLLLDVPSVDREEDGGKLAAHHVFWNYPEAPESSLTITELIYVREHIKDGRYLLNLQITSFMNDAAPSKPVLYALIET